MRDSSAVDTMDGPLTGEAVAELFRASELLAELESTDLELWTLTL